MSWKIWAGIFFLFIMGAFLSLIYEATYFGGDVSDITRILLGYDIASMQGPGILAVPKMTVGFFTHGLPKVLLWDYAYLQGDWVVLRIILIVTLSVPTVVELGLAVLITAQGILSNILSLWR